MIEIVPFAGMTEVQMTHSFCRFWASMVVAGHPITPHTGSYSGGGAKSYRYVSCIVQPVAKDYKAKQLAKFEGNSRDVSRLQIESLLYNILPESCSVVYYGLVQRFQTTSSKYFKNNLEKMFTAEPSPCY
ncbi:uncharacterized protein LOC131332120 [Rhododendron vialii]|uniref:uncharacterized protein LOC131332120 n=1 Tax=Rhododendron vialii TaxID=182163 RepID=UPI00265F8F9A|nr:uncharacterized protein LOC131332120 [Rhododendron vialii]